MTPPPLPLYLMRHGAPTRTGLLLGRTDLPVTPAGIAACVARAADLPVTAIVTSDLIRAAACATAIAHDRTLVPSVDPRWRELDFGEWDGLPPAQIDPEALARFWQDLETNPPPQGQHWSSLTHRLPPAIAALTQPTLVITHGGTMRAALAVLCGFAQRELWAFDLPYASVIALRVWPGETPSAQIVGLST